MKAVQLCGCIGLAFSLICSCSNERTSKAPLPSKDPAPIQASTEASSDDSKPAPLLVNPTVGKDRKLFLSPELSFYDNHVFYNGEPFGMSMDSCCSGPWHFVLERQYKLQCADNADRVLEISLQAEDPEPKFTSVMLRTKKSLHIFLDGAEITSYAAEATLAEDGTFTAPAQLYPLERFFRGIQQAELYAYQCGPDYAKIWLDIERELHLAGGDTIAASREQFILDMHPSKNFVWIVDANMNTGARRAQQGRELLSEEMHERTCPAEVWPCDPEERARLVHDYIEDHQARTSSDYHE